MTRKVVVLSALALAACGIDAVGSLAKDTVAPSPAGSVAGGDAGGGAPAPVDCTGSCTLPEAPPPFELVLFGDAAAPCPAGFDAVDAYEDPAPDEGSCGCGPCVMTGTDCNSGTIGSRYSSGTACDGIGGNGQANGGNCFEYDGYFISTYASVVPPPAVPGTCTAPGQGVRAKVAAKAERRCVRRADTCAEAACGAGADLRVCLEAPGDVACPGSVPDKHLVGDDVELTCADCTCTTKATCTGTESYYQSDDCTGTPLVLQANVCTRVDGQDIGSEKWTGKVATETCVDLSPADKATVTLASVHTVCCP